MPTEKLAGRTQKEVEKARDELKDWRKKLDELEEKIKKITKEGVGKACSETKEIAQLVQVREKAQITIPSKIRKALNIKEGDYLEAEVEDNKMVLIPKILVDKAEAVTLSRKGEEMLKEALDDVKKGKVKEFKDVEELIDDLHK